jgi:hypothetical protein
MIVGAGKSLALVPYGPAIGGNWGMVAIAFDSPNFALFFGSGELNLVF